jgi:hypothetical protein
LLSHWRGDAFLAPLSKVSDKEDLMIHRASGSAYALLLLLFVAAASVHAQDSAAATPSQMRELRAEVNRLDDALSTVRDDNPRAQEFRDREKRIREDLQWLRDEMLKHQQDETKGLAATSKEVESLRNEIRDLRHDIDASFGDASFGDTSTLPASDTDPAQPAEFDVPEGTQIQVRLEDPLSSKTSRPEEHVVATIAEPVYGERRGGRPAIPAGTPVRGFVQSVQPAERPARGGRLDLTFNQLLLGDETVRIDARVIDMQQGGLNKHSAGLGAVVGGVLGAVLDGAKGAVVGAILGGGGAVVATSGKDVELPAGTLLTLRLERPLRVARR